MVVRGDRVRPAAIIILLAKHDGENPLERRLNFGSKDREVSCYLPANPRQQHQVIKRIQLKFSLPNCSIFAEGIRVSIDQNVFRLALDDFLQQIRFLRI